MKILDIMALLLLAALWGVSFLFMRLASPVLGPVWLIECRVLVAGLALLPFLVRLDLLRVAQHHWKSLLVVGGINSALPFLLFAFSSLFLSAGLTSILNATTPLFGTLVAFLWLKEPLTVNRSIGILLGFTGVIVLVGRQAYTATPWFLFAVGAGLLGALLYAIAAPYVKQQLSEVPALVTTTGSQLSAAILLLPVLPFTIPATSPSAIITLTVLALALLSTAFAYLLFFRLIRHIGSTQTLTVTYLIPLFAFLWSAIGLGEPITLTMLGGCSLILLGTAIANGVLFRSLVKPH